MKNYHLIILNKTEIKKEINCERFCGMEKMYEVFQAEYSFAFSSFVLFIFTSIKTTKILE